MCSQQVLNPLCPIVLSDADKLFEHDLGALNMAALNRRVERAGLLSNLGPCCKALCARRDFAIRRQLLKNDKVADRLRLSFFIFRLTPLPSSLLPISTCCFSMILSASFRAWPSSTPSRRWSTASCCRWACVSSGGLWPHRRLVQRGPTQRRHRRRQPRLLPPLPQVPLGEAASWAQLSPKCVCPENEMGVQDVKNKSLFSSLRFWHFFSSSFLFFLVLWRILTLKPCEYFSIVFFVWAPPPSLPQMEFCVRRNALNQV